MADPVDMEEAKQTLSHLTIWSPVQLGSLHVPGDTPSATLLSMAATTAISRLSQHTDTVLPAYVVLDGQRLELEEVTGMTAAQLSGAQIYMDAAGPVTLELNTLQEESDQNVRGSTMDDFKTEYSLPQLSDEQRAWHKQEQQKLQQAYSAVMLSIQRARERMEQHRQQQQQQ